MKKTICLLALLSTTLLAVVAEAGQGKAGLWEVSTTTDVGAAMPAMSAEQRAMMQKMGVQLPSASTVTTKQCVTPEQAASDTLAAPGDTNDGCTSSAPVVDGSTVTVKVTCDGEMKGSGTATATYSSDSSYSGRFTMKGTASGQPIDLKSDFRGTWLGADCGGVKPLTP